jgi:hypothetical protein
MSHVDKEHHIKPESQEMSIAVQWKNKDQTILQLDYAGASISWADYDAALEKSFRMVRTR